MNFKKRVNGSWDDTPHYIHNTSTDTITTPAVLYPNDTTATVGLKGNMYQASGVSPTTPIQPQSCGERTGQLIEYPYFNESGTISSVQWTISENGHIKGVGTTIGGTNFFLNRNCFLKAGTYTLKIYGKHDGMALRIYDTVNTTVIATIFRSNSDSFTTFTLDSDTSNECNIYFNVASAGVNVDIDCDIMLNTGSTPLPYELYGYKIPISSANTTTPVYLGEVQTTRRIKKLVLDGTENWLKGNYPPTGGYQFFTPKPADIANNPDWLTTHFKKGSGLNGSLFGSYLSLYPEASILPENASANHFKAWLAAQYAAGTPVCVWYVLATETTGIVNEPLRKIGDYADEVSGITIPTIAGANTIDIDTTLKPSEVTVNYHGWHPVADVHEADNGAWT